MVTCDDPFSPPPWSSARRPRCVCRPSRETSPGSSDRSPDHVRPRSQRSATSAREQIERGDADPVRRARGREGDDEVGATAAQDIAERPPGRLGDPTPFRVEHLDVEPDVVDIVDGLVRHEALEAQIWRVDRKSTRLNSSHGYISYAVFCLKKKKLPRRRLNPH